MWQIVFSCYDWLNLFYFWFQILYTLMCVCDLLIMNCCSESYGR
jgi:hypothetical protein